MNFFSFLLSYYSNILYAMYRIQNQASHLVTSHTTGAPPTFLGTLFGGWLIYTKRLFDKYVVSGICHLTEYRWNIEYRLFLNIFK